MRRVRRAKDKEEIYKQLVAKENDLNFGQMTDVFTLAACVGFYHNKMVSFTKTAEPIQWIVFSEDNRNTLKMIAYAYSMDPDVLLEDGEDDGENMLKIVEGFANGGLEVLKKKVLDMESKVDRLDAVVELILSGYESQENVSSEEILKQIIK